jgi:hypothetical protein
MVKEKAGIPASEQVTLVEVSADTPSPLSLLSGSCAQLGQKELLWLVFTDPGFLFATFGIAVLPIALQVCPIAFLILVCSSVRNVVSKYSVFLFGVTLLFIVLQLQALA